MPAGTVVTVGTTWLGLELGGQRAKTIDRRHGWIESGNGKRVEDRLTRGSKGGTWERTVGHGAGT
jgi:hypothetical protein